MTSNQLTHMLHAHTRNVHESKNAYYVYPWELSFSFDKIVILLSRVVSKMDIFMTLEKRAYMPGHT